LILLLTVAAESLFDGDAKRYAIIRPPQMSTAAQVVPAPLQNHQNAIDSWRAQATKKAPLARVTGGREEPGAALATHRGAEGASRLQNTGAWGALWLRLRAIARLP